MAKASTTLEVDIQATFRKRCYYSAPTVQIVAIPNAARRTQWEVNRAKKEGLRTGFPDVMCLWAGSGVCFIEFKSAKGRLSDHQIEWGQRLVECGHQYAVCRSADEAMVYLRACGAPVAARVMA